MTLHPGALTVKIWDLRSNNRDPIQTLDDFKDSVTRVMVLEEGGRAGKGPGGKEVLATSVDGCLRTYDIRKGVMWMDDCKEPLSSVSVSGDGQCVLMNGLDGVVRLLERSTGEMLNNYQGYDCWQEVSRKVVPIAKSTFYFHPLYTRQTYPPGLSH
jgi:mitogen-activated protein kinase organizer 1